MENIKDFKTNIKEIVFSDEEERSFCDIFVYEPENIEEKSLGNLYIIGEVVNLPENSSYIVNLLASIIKKEFYSNKKRTTLESLEASLNKANSTLSDLTEQGNVAWIGNLNMTCAAHRLKELHLSQTGKIKTLLIRDGKIKDIGKNIIAEEKPHPFRTFANIASGELELNDLVLFATPGLFNVLSTEKIRQLSSSGDFGSFSNSIQEAMENESSASTIAALLVNVESKKEEARIPQVRILPEELPKEAGSALPATAYEKRSESGTTDRAAENEVAPFELGEGAEKISLENIIKEFEDREIARQKTEMPSANVSEPAPIQRQITPEQRPQAYVPPQNIEAERPVKDLDKQEENIQTEKTGPKMSTGNIMGAAFAKAGNILSMIKNRSFEMLSKLKISKGPEADFTSRLRLMRNSKIVFSTMILIFIVLLGNVVISNYNNQIEAEKQKYADLLEQARTKIDEADEVLIYNDSEKARQSLIEAKAIAIEVRDGYKNLSADASALIDRVQVQMDKIDKIFRIEKPAVALDLSKNEKISDASTLTLFEKNYYTIGQDSSVYRLDLASGNAEEVKLSIKNTDSAGKTKLATTLSKTGEIIFLTEDNKLLSFDAEKSELRSLKIELGEDLSNIAAISSYNSFIYLLEPGSNQIYKHQKTADGFGKGTKWINEKNPTDIRNATSMAIDSTIYVLRSNGQIEEYLTGNKVKFSVEEPKDPAVNPTIIFTETGLKNIYVADPLKNRVIVFDKEKGTLLKQFIVKDFNSGIKDMTADENEEFLFVLSGSSIFKLEIASETK